MIKKEVFTGLIMGIVGLIFGICLTTYLLSLKDAITFDEVLDGFKESGNFWMLICLGGVVNLGLFFMCLKKNQDYRARGILLATFIAAITAYIIRFV